MEHRHQSFSEDLIDSDVLSSIQEVLGNLEDYKSSKVFHSHLVCYQNGALKQIHTDEHSPKCLQDYMGFNGLRILSDISIISGRSLRVDPGQLNRANFDKLKISSAFFRSDNKRIVYVLTKTLTINFFAEHEFYQDQNFTKIISSEKQLVESFIKEQSELEQISQEDLIKKLRDSYNLNFLGLEHCSLKSVVSHIQEKENSSKVIIETGSTILYDLYSQDYHLNPIDTLLLTIFQGEIKASNVTEAPFPSLDMIMRNFRLVRKNKPIINQSGCFIITVWQKIDDEKKRYTNEEVLEIKRQLLQTEKGLHDIKPHHNKTIFDAVYGTLIVCSNKQKKWLITKESDDRGYSLPGGAVEANETFVEAALRECYEETGLHVQLKGILKIDCILFNLRSNIRIIFYAEYESYDSDSNTERISGSGNSKWLTLEELKDLETREVMRRKDLAIWAEYLEQGGQIFPLSLLGHDLDIPSSQNRAFTLLKE